jgi:hypothetical protein
MPLVEMTQAAVSVSGFDDVGRDIGRGIVYTASSIERFGGRATDSHGAAVRGLPTREAATSGAARSASCEETCMMDIRAVRCSAINRWVEQSS